MRQKVRETEHVFHITQGQGTRADKGTAPYTLHEMGDYSTIFGRVDRKQGYASNNTLGPP